MKGKLLFFITIGFGVMPLAAELPSLAEKVWLGHFVGIENRKYHFGITTDGKATLRLMGKEDKPIGQKLTIDVEFLVEELLPEGLVYLKKLIPDSLESAQAATHEPKNVVFRGKVKGDAVFEIQVHEDRGVLSLGGRLLDKGTLTKYPLRMSIRVKIPNAYPYGAGAGNKQRVKAFEDKTKSDYVRLVWDDGKKAKFSTAEPLDEKPQVMNTSGIVSAEVEFSSFQEKRLIVSVSEGAALMMEHSATAALKDGFSLMLVADPQKDLDGKARIVIEVK